MIVSQGIMRWKKIISQRKVWHPFLCGRTESMLCRITHEILSLPAFAEELKVSQIGRKLPVSINF